ncbi:hypothetical protein ERJ75_001514300 [Trypanosoma vivax]|nr:hypothetical protein TRVL_05322 [Trypanosoma vivax]KAH8606446.1 hypothetical protein ERJ75_001514300 [Trypanosoma vivax]
MPPVCALSCPANLFACVVCFTAQHNRRRARHVDCNCFACPAARADCPERELVIRRPSFFPVVPDALAKLIDWDEGNRGASHPRIVGRRCGNNASLTEGLGSQRIGLVTAEHGTVQADAAAQRAACLACEEPARCGV